MTENSTPAASTNPAPPTPNPYRPVNEYPVPESGPNWPLIEATTDLIASLPNADEVLEGWYVNDLPELIEVPAEDVEKIKTGQAWSQGNWRCSTGMCFAGWASALTGAEFAYDAKNQQQVNTADGYANAREVVRTADGTLRTIEAYAREVLALPSRQSHALFDGDNTLEHIRTTLNVMKEYPAASYEQLRQAVGDEECS